MITAHAGGCTTPFPFEAAIWLLEELEELYGGAVPICGQARARDTVQGRDFSLLNLRFWRRAVGGKDRDL